MLGRTLENLIGVQHWATQNLRKSSWVVTGCHNVFLLDSGLWCNAVFLVLLYSRLWQTLLSHGCVFW